MIVQGRVEPRPLPEGALTDLVTAVREFFGRPARDGESGADIVGFGVDVVERDGRTGGTYERRLQPAHDRRDGSDVLTGLFSEGGRAQGQLWRHLYRTSLLREAHALVPDDLALARVNDLPLEGMRSSLRTRCLGPAPPTTKGPGAARCAGPTPVGEVRGLT